MAIERFKGLLKSVCGGLKIALTTVPAFFSVGAFATGIGLLISDSVEYTKFMEDYSKTDIYVQRVSEDLKELSDQVADQKISGEDLSDKLEYYSSYKYKEDLIKEDREENAEFQAILKQSNLKSNWGLGLLFGGAALIIAVAIQYLVCVDKFSSFFESGVEDVGSGFKAMFGKKNKNSSTQGQISADIVSYSSVIEQKSAYKLDGEEIIPELDEDSF